MTITPVEADALDEVLDLVATEQAERSRGTTMLGDERDGVAAELGDLEPAWASTVRVAREDGRVVAASLVEWDEENARAGRGAGSSAMRSVCRATQSACTGQSSQAGRVRVHIRAPRSISPCV